MNSIEKKHKRIIKAIEDGLFEREREKESIFKMTERNGKYIEINTRDNIEIEYTQDIMIDMIEKIEKSKEYEELTDWKTVAQLNAMRLEPITKKNQIKKTLAIWQRANRIDIGGNIIGYCFIKNIKNGNLTLEYARYILEKLIEFTKLDLKKSNTSEKYIDDGNDMIVTLEIQLLKLEVLGRTQMNVVTTDQKRANQNQTPTLKKETANVLFEILKEYFDKDRYLDLKGLFVNGKTPKNKLVFNDNANRLTDTFKQLFDNNLLLKCNKEVLKKWLVANFQFVKKGIISDLKPNTVHKSISGDQYHCKNPIIEIKEGKILSAKKSKNK